MARYVFLVMVNAVDGQDAALNAWLDDHHLPEVIRTEGFISVQRYQLAAEEAGNAKAVHRYMHLYEVETDDLTKTKEALRIDSAKRTATSPALDLSTVFTTYYKASGEPVFPR